MLWKCIAEAGRVRGKSMDTPYSKHSRWLLITLDKTRKSRSERLYLQRFRTSVFIPQELVCDLWQWPRKRL